MSESGAGKSGVPGAHRPETEDPREEVAPGDRHYSNAAKDVPEVDLTLKEMVSALEAKRDRLKQVIVRAGEVKADAQRRIVDARAELVGVERLLKAAKPRGSK